MVKTRLNNDSVRSNSVGSNKGYVEKIAYA